MGSKMVVRILSSSLALILSAMLCSTLTFGAVDVAKESGSGSLTSVDFGEVAVGSSSQEQLVVTNTNAELIDLRFTLSYGSSCKITLLTDSTAIGVDVGNSVNVVLEYEPLAEEACSGGLYIIYTGQTSKSTAFATLTLVGTGVPEDIPDNPVGTVLIDGQDTGVEDKLYKEQPISVWLDDCAAKARNHGQYMQCVALLTRHMKRNRVLEEEDRQTIQKAAAHANIPPRKSGIEELEYNGEPVTELIKECKENAENRKQYVRCVSELMKEMKKEGIIKTRKDKHLVRRYAARLRFHDKHHK